MITDTVGLAKIQLENLDKLIDKIKADISGSDTMDQVFFHRGRLSGVIDILARMGYARLNTTEIIPSSEVKNL